MASRCASTAASCPSSTKLPSRRKLTPGKKRTRRCTAQPDQSKISNPRLNDQPGTERWPRPHDRRHHGRSRRRPRVHRRHGHPQAIHTLVSGLRVNPALYQLRRAPDTTGNARQAASGEDGMTLGCARNVGRPASMRPQSDRAANDISWTDSPGPRPTLRRREPAPRITAVNEPGVARIAVPRERGVG